MGQKEHAINAHAVFFLEKAEAKGPFGRHRCIWENIKMNLTETECQDVEGIYLVQDMDQW
jgi:hypothetical protein